VATLVRAIVIAVSLLAGERPLSPDKDLDRKKFLRVEATLPNDWSHLGTDLAHLQFHQDRYRGQVPWSWFQAKDCPAAELVGEGMVVLCLHY